ncbi:hypothetical protein V5799_009798 [Amblyomma americanum]|uniref:Uncharacterized protein n=1 Tax=Amblyomma americanum TaxID=6943 RepID=A0AAQ4F9E1_AMBAM
MWSGAPPSPVPPPSPGEDAGVLAVHGGSEGDAAAAAVLTPTSPTPVTSLYGCSWSTAFAMANDAAKTPLPVAIDGLTYDGSPPTPATLLFSAEGSGDRFLGGGCGGDAAATDVRSHRQCGHWLQPPEKSSASPVAVATVSRRKINNRAQCRHCCLHYDIEVPVLMCREAGRPEYQSSPQLCRNASGGPSVSPLPPSPGTPTDIADDLGESPLDSTTDTVRLVGLSSRAERLPYASGDNSLDDIPLSP